MERENPNYVTPAGLIICATNCHFILKNLSSWQRVQILSYKKCCLKNEAAVFILLLNAKSIFMTQVDWLMFIILINSQKLQKGSDLHILKETAAYTPKTSFKILSCHLTGKLSAHEISLLSSEIYEAARMPTMIFKVRYLSKDTFASPAIWSVMCFAFYAGYFYSTYFLLLLEYWNEHILNKSLSLQFCQNFGKFLEILRTISRAIR